MKFGSCGVFFCPKYSLIKRMWKTFFVQTFSETFVKPENACLVSRGQNVFFVKKADRLVKRRFFLQTVNGRVGENGISSPNKKMGWRIAQSYFFRETVYGGIRGIRTFLSKQLMGGCEKGKSRANKKMRECFAKTGKMRANKRMGGIISRKYVHTVIARR